MTLDEKTAYLRGLIDGLSVDASSKEGKIINAIADCFAAAASDNSKIAVVLREHTEALKDNNRTIHEIVHMIDDVLAWENDHDDDDDDDDDYWDEDEFDDMEPEDNVDILHNLVKDDADSDGDDRK